ncbi:MAG: hypothetical protein IJI51_03560 [Lachnospiraceae bacterium]|nr:hypothetical protein [Lachnospiraceae bacterium]
MKSCTGTYCNLFSDTDSDNYGLRVKFDIMIVFPEHFGYGLEPDCMDTLELMVEKALKHLGAAKPYAKKEDVFETVKQVLKTLEYDYNHILVTQALTCKELAKEFMKTA